MFGLSKEPVTKEELDSIEEFLTHFEIEPSVELRSCLDRCKTSLTEKDQDEFRYHLAKMIATTDHPVFTDPVMDNIRTKCEAAYKTYENK